jgi:hypothetical protein
VEEEERLGFSSRSFELGRRTRRWNEVEFFRERRDFRNKKASSLRKSENFWAGERPSTAEEEIQAI